MAAALGVSYSGVELRKLPPSIRIRLGQVRIGIKLRILRIKSCRFELLIVDRDAD